MIIKSFCILAILHFFNQTALGMPAEVESEQVNGVLMHTLPYAAMKKRCASSGGASITTPLNTNNTKLLLTCLSSHQKNGAYDGLLLSMVNGTVQKEKVVVTQLTPEIKFKAS